MKARIIGVKVELREDEDIKEMKMVIEQDENGENVEVEREVSTPNIVFSDMRPFNIEVNDPTELGQYLITSFQNIYDTEKK